ncbi:histone-lysine N-methyltransferase 2A-like [Palaemon carinicauda]|uniref:histone-lysine N-methyltransferase 2A-like n=1 Tax=Palaemon carinicauda TaxID=392227 RepID=UPI0035B65A12
MAKFRFPGKALKLNTRKRVRFRGRYPNNTPEELYTRRIRRGLDLFHKLFGDSDEDEDEFEGFTNGMCKEKAVVPTPKPKAPEKKVEEVCSSLEKEGLVRRTRTSAVAMAVKEVRELKEKKAQALDERTRVKTPPAVIRDKEGVTSEKGVHESTVVTVPNVVVPPGRRKRVPMIGHSAHKQTNCRVGRQPTVKTALAKKLLAKAKKKLPSLPVVGEKSPKRFILPTMSARSSRIIKPNKRLFADITEMCSTSSSVELQANAEAAESKNSLSLSSKRLVKLRKTRSHSTRLFRGHGAGTVKGSEGVGRDRMRRTISLYTEAITGPCRGQVGRPPKRLLRRLEAPHQDFVEDMPESPQKCDLKESRVKEKIEKLLRSPWDDRLKQTGKGGKCEGDEMMPAPASTTSPALSAISRNILRKARLNLNKSTLLKIRNPDSLQRLIPQSDEGKVEGKCIICDRDEGENTRKFGVTICEICCSFVSNASDGPKEIFECLDSKGSCQIQGVEEEERCLACWLGRILQTCFMANILHDRLRKRLPPPLKEKIPTSLARCMNLGTAAAATEKDAELNSHTKRLPLDPGGAGGGGGVGGAFGNVMDLPGGWRRKTGSEVVVISPSGEKFKSMQKLEEYLKNQGICADARVLFGNSSSVVEKTVEVKSRPTPSTKSNKRGRVVMTTLPGGWTRRIKWRSAGDRFDTYVFSPDGRTFRSKRELSAHFQAIGKIDDIHKYFPVVNGNSDSSTPSSSDNTGSSSTEPVSSSEIGSDISSDDKSPEASEVEFETPTIEAPKVNLKTSKVKIKSNKLKSGEDGPESLKIIDSKVDSHKVGGINASPGEKVLKKYSDKSSKPATDEDEGPLRSSSRQSEKADFSEEVLSDLRTNDSENHKTERKHKKTKGSRTRSLSLTSKQRDNSPTDTTESESEQGVAEGTFFTKSFGDERCKTTSSVSEIESPEKRGLCSAWNTIICGTPGDEVFESYTSKKFEERRPSMKLLNRKRKNTVEEGDNFAVPNLVSDTKANTEKVILKISKNSLTPFEEPTKNRTREGTASGVLEQEEETSGVVSQASTAESPTPPLIRKKPSSCEEQEQDYGTEDESHDSTAESLISSLTKTRTSSTIKSIISRAKIRPKLKKKTSKYESVPFGNGWSRKIKWNEKGEGKVALLHSPDGQTIRSRIELLAYFKKAGVTKVDLDYYFPPNLKRSKSPLSLNSVGDATTLSVATLGSGHSSDMSDISDSESVLKTSEDSSASMEDGSRRRRRVISDYSRLGRTLDVSSSLVDGGGRVPHFARSGKKIIVVTGKSGKIPIIKNEMEEPPVVLPEPGGPRVKHVCRSQAQVLKGIQRAVFPSPEKDGKQDLDSSSPIIETKKKRKREVVTVLQKAASGKILQKTMWCNKCTGCNTPNCRKCVNCLDMKKFGGPGTKKKPCIKRKCLNPRLSAKSAQSAMVQDRKFKRALPLSITSEPIETKERPRSPVEPEEKSLSKPDVVEEKVDIVIKVSTQDKSSVFVPRQMTRVQPDQKDRCDIAAGKKFVPGALVNIDYWQGYDVDEMLLSGFSVTTSSPLYPQTLCFRCGSAGKERLTFCIWCCEGVHPFCMEDGEGPESDTEEILWICRRCAVCHVCGAPGADSLLRCSDCRNYYHMECLGPSAHSTCQPSPDRPWKCVGCTRCSSCGNPNVSQWLSTYNKITPIKAKSPGEDHTLPNTELALCDRCVALREQGNYCPLCNGCYEDDDYDSKMMECGRCGEWIHAHCESLNNEHYQILSFLPDTVEYVCRTCLLETSSNWLDAVNNELLAGCEAVISALLNSKCAKHLVKKELQKLSTSLLSPLSCLPTLSATSLQKKIELLDTKGDCYLEPTVSGSQVNSSPGQCYGNFEEKLPLRGDRGRECAISNENQIHSHDGLVTSHTGDIAVDQISNDGKSSSALINVCGQPVNSQNLKTHSPSLDENASKMGKGDTGFSGFHYEFKHTPMTSASSDIVFESDVVSKNDRERKMSSDAFKEKAKVKKKRHTRTSLPPEIGTGNQSDGIKLRECSVRLEDICKSRSASSSPKFLHDSDSEEQSDSQERQNTTIPKLHSLPKTNTFLNTGDLSSQLRNKMIGTGQVAQLDKEGERGSGSSFHSLLNMKDTDLCTIGRDVSCTQVDGPNDETTTASHVIRNLFYEDRNLSMLESTAALLDKKCETVTKDKKFNSSLAQVENQLISPKDKITKDIDDDCVSSEASSYCDTDTEIESIQDDPEEPKDLLSVKDKLREGKYNTVLQFHVDTARVIENGRHLNRVQTRNVLVTYAKHMKESFPWFELKAANIFELVDRKRPFPLPYFDHNYAFHTQLLGNTTHHQFSLRDMPASRKRSISPLKGQNSTPDRRKCALCAREGDDEPNYAGRLLYLGQDEWMHINCGLWSSEVYEEVDGGLQNVYLAVNRGRLVKCSTCQERGATVGCCHKTCQATYHFMCARRSYCQFMEDKRIYCPVHMSATNGEEKSDDFQVNRCVYVDMDSEKKKWKQVPGNRVNIIVGSLVIRSLGRIVPESDSSEALIPIDFICTRKYWSTVDPTKQVSYTCRTKKVMPSLEDALSGEGAAAIIHRTIDHSKGEVAVEREMAAVRKWFKHLEESKVEKKSRETNIIPPHLCPLYRSIKENEVVRNVDQVARCRTPPAVVESDVRQCIDDIIDKVSRSVEEESLLFDNDLPAIVSADDNELISMVLNDLDACDPITLHSTPSTSGRPSPLDMEFLSNCDHMMDSGKVSHSGTLSQETVGNSQVMLDDDPVAASLTPPVLHSQALSQPSLEPPQSHPLHHHHHHSHLIHQNSSYQVQQPAPISSTAVMGDVVADEDDVKEPIMDTVPPPSILEEQQHLGSVPLIPSISSAKSNNSSSTTTQTSTSSPSQSSCSDNKSDSSSSNSSSSSSSSNSSNSSSSGSTGGENSSPERSIGGIISNTSSPDACCRAVAENLGVTDSNSDSSQSARCILQNSSTLASAKASSALKQICRVLPMPSTNSGRRSSSASEHSDNIAHDQSPPVSRRSPRISGEHDTLSSSGKGSERKKICMKRNYKTVIKKYPLRSGMRKSKPYETVQIEINETIEIPRGEGSGMMRKSLKRKWSGILDSDEEQEVKEHKESGDQEGQEHESNHGISDDENGKDNSVSKKVLKFSDDNSDITVSIVNNNNNLCDFSKSRVHKYRHKTVLQLDGAADGSSSSAEMSESQDEGLLDEGERSRRHEDSQTPPLHSALAMRIKEQSLARSSPGEEGPYKCGKCKRLYRTKESYQKHIETCTFEVDSSSTSEDEDDPYESNKLEDEDEEEEVKADLPSFPVSGTIHEISDIPKCSMSIRTESGVDSASPKIPLQDFSTSQNISLIENIVSNLEAKGITGNVLDEATQDNLDVVLGRTKAVGEEQTVKKIRLDTNLPRQPGVHRQVRTAIKKSSLASGEDVELVQVIPGGPSPGTDVFVPPPVSPVKFSPIVKKNSSPRRYSNVRLLRGPRNYSYRRAPPMPSQEHHYQGINSGIQMAPATAVTAAPLQVTMQPMVNTSAQLITPAAPTAATFQQFSGQSSPYSTTTQLASPVTLSPAMQMASPVATQVAQQVSPQVNPQVLTVVSAPSVAVPQGYTLQYVGSFRDGEMGPGGGSLVTYPTTPVVVPQPQLVVTPQQSSVVMPQVVNTNITYSFTTPETLVINQPTMVSGMQSVQYLPQQQQQPQTQTQVIQQHPEQQVTSVMQYNPAAVSSQQGTQIAASHHIQHSTGQMHSPCLSFSDIHNSQICRSQPQQTANILPQELSFSTGGANPVHLNPSIGATMSTSMPCHTPSVSLPTCSTIGNYSTQLARQRPQASVAPQIVQPLSSLNTITSTAMDTSSIQESVSHSRLPFSERPISGVRTVATVAPAVITTTSVISLPTCSATTKLTTAETSPKVATVRPRPTYSYRDAMKDKQVERQKHRQEVLHIERVIPNEENQSKEFLKAQNRLQSVASDSESDSEGDFASRNADKDKKEQLETQSYRLVVRKDTSTSSGFSVLPISGPDAPLPAPEVKELRIKAKVSVGPKRKKTKSRDEEKDLIFANKDISQDLYVNEQLPNFSVNPMLNPSQDDPSIFEKPKTCSTEPYIVFELTSEDGFHVESRHISEVWQKVFDAVSAARANMKMDAKGANSVQSDSGPGGGAMSGLHMLGLTHNAVQYLLEQLPGAKDCHKYSFQFHRRPQEEGAVEENPTGCARTESFKMRSPYDIFSWLASKHRRMPERAPVQQDEIQLSTRRATSLELPMAMRYRHLRETAREAVGVFRSCIHGRGLFCKRDIDSGEMVIEYAGQVIRSSMCDMREKDYESKGIGCYMFRIDDDTVIDATMHGNAARFINHSCDPNCYSRVVDILGKKHIIIFALRRIMRGEELTYDYKFPIEDDKIPCTCGTRRCRKYLN